MVGKTGERREGAEGGGLWVTWTREKNTTSISLRDGVVLYATVDDGLNVLAHVAIISSRKKVKTGISDL
jgi:hypothetical protein